jgi:hypothetical protein
MYRVSKTVAALVLGLAVSALATPSVAAGGRNERRARPRPCASAPVRLENSSSTPGATSRSRPTAPAWRNTTSRSSRGFVSRAQRTTKVVRCKSGLPQGWVPAALLGGHPRPHRRCRPFPVLF